MAQPPIDDEPVTHAPRHDPPGAAVVFAAFIAAGIAAAGVYSQPYLSDVGNAIITACGALAGATLLYALYPSQIRVAAVTVLIVALAGAGVAWTLLRLSQPIPDGVASLIGGCDRFNLYAQNRYPPLGARVMAEPLPDSTKIGSRAGNDL